MMTKKKKGFTIVELVIVIAVIGILAAVLIPTFTSLVEEARQSNDRQIVYFLNQSAERVDIKVAEGKVAEIKTMHDAVEAMDDIEGFNITKLTPTSTKCDILWDSTANRFVLVNENGEVVACEGNHQPDMTTKTNLWKVYETVPDTSNPETSEGYSIYLKGTRVTGTVSVTGVGLDVGNNNGITEVNYTNTSSAKEVVIRTNGGTLYVGSSTAIAKGTVTHYGSLDNSVVYTEDNSFHTHGKIAEMQLKAGKAVALDGGYVALINAESGTQTIEDGGVFYIPSGTEASAINSTVAENLGYKTDSVSGNLVIDTTTPQGQARTETLANNPYEIHNTEELMAFGRAVNAGQDFTQFAVKVMNNIDVKGQQLEPIGTPNHPFNGVFEGNGYTISNYKITGINNYAGLFGYVFGAPNQDYDHYDDVWENDALVETNITESHYSAVIKNVKIEGAECSSAKKYAASLVAFGNNLYLYNCSVSGSTISTGKVAGGLAGALNGSIVKNCSSASDNSVTASGYHAGGLVCYLGYYDANSVYPDPYYPSALIDSENAASLNCINTSGNGGAYGGVVAAINATKDIGATSLVYNCVNRGNITLNPTTSSDHRSQAGGIVGSGQGISMVAKCVNHGNITVNSNHNGSNGEGNFIAGIVATMSGGTTSERLGVYQCENKGNITVTTTTNTHFVAGVIASLDTAGESTNVRVDGCKNTGVIKCENSAQEAKGYVSTILSQIRSSGTTITYKNMSFANIPELSAALPQYLTDYSASITIDTSVTVTDKTGVLEIGYIRRINAYDGLCSQFTFKCDLPALSGSHRGIYVNIPNATLVISSQQDITGGIVRLEADGMGFVNNGTYRGGIEFMGNNVTVVNNGQLLASNGNTLCFYGNSATITHTGTFGQGFGGIQLAAAGTFIVDGANPWAASGFTITHEGNVYTVTQD